MCVLSFVSSLSSSSSIQQEQEQEQAEAEEKGGIHHLNTVGCASVCCVRVSFLSLSFIRYIYHTQLLLVRRLLHLLCFKSLLSSIPPSLLLSPLCVWLCGRVSVAVRILRDRQRETEEVREEKKNTNRRVIMVCGVCVMTVFSSLSYTFLFSFLRQHDKPNN